MFDKTKIQDSLFGLVGFQNPINPDYAIVDVDNQESRSGRYATEHPWCKIEYLKENQDYIDASDADFNTALQGLQQRSISEVVGRVTTDIDYIDRQVLFQNANNKVNTDALPVSNFVGYRINKDLVKNVAFEVKRIFLEFQGAGTVKLLMFNSAVKEPIFEQEVTISSSQQTQDLNWRIDNTGDYFQGDFYLGYLSDNVAGGVLPYERDYQSSNVKSCITHMYWENIKVPNVTTEELFDLDNIDGADECWGLNPDIVVFNDYTDLVIQQEALFANAIQLQMSINSIQSYLYSLRSNRHQRLAEEQFTIVLAQIEGAEGLTGLRPTLEKEIKRLNQEIKKLKDGMFSDSFFQLNTLT